MLSSYVETTENLTTTFQCGSEIDIGWFKSNQMIVNPTSFSATTPEVIVQPSYFCREGSKFHLLPLKGGESINSKMERKYGVGLGFFKGVMILFLSHFSQVIIFIFILSM